MAYQRGNNANIIVGAAAFYVSAANQAILTELTLPSTASGVSYKETLSTEPKVRNVGYTSNGVDITFTPSFGEVTVDQLLDVAKLYKSGMQVSLKTSFAEATLENLLLSIAQKGAISGSTATFSGWTDGTVTTNPGKYIDILSGDLGDYPVERSIIAIGPGNAANIVGGSAATNEVERIYVGYRAVSITNVTVSAKRDAATMFDVEFRLLPNDNGSYGKIIDRTF